MNRKILTPLLALMLALPLGASAQSTQKLTASKASDYGIVYSLPRTVVDVTMTAECTVKTPGEFYKYAERYLGAEAARKAIAKPSTTWELTSASISSRGVASNDPDSTYLMQFKSGSNVVLIADRQGLPLALGTERTLAPEAAPAAPKPTKLTASPLDSPAARQAVTGEMVSGSSLAKRAELAAQQIMTLRENRRDYLTGEAETMPDGAALKLILSNIDAQEEALTAMFLGTVQTRTDVCSVSYTPQADGPDDVVIARLNPQKGFVSADDLSGTPIYLKTKVTSRGKLPLTEKGEPRKLPKGAVAYCIPGQADFSVSWQGKTFASKPLEVAQLGVIFGLDPAIFTDKKAPSYAIFDPTTGAVRELGTVQ